ncbi:ATP-dependent helicase MrfA [Bacillus carboniphilus]|uniref:ATP-dependent helicase MrfA n=1 Tax=Bacillus carboniphilus TaxID=86663 RepID=A0ABP3GNT2_9BACI
MFGKRSIDDAIKYIKNNEQISENIVHWEKIEAKSATYVEMPEDLSEPLRIALQKRGIEKLYSHQGEALQLARQKKSFVAITPTASGKTLCYNLPVIESILQNQETRALYLFPTKALAQDQKNELHELTEGEGLHINSYTYDGDTSPSIRQKIRKAGHIVMTNPDMLHSGILPHHTKWVSLFENLQYVVIDELHTYRGVFGSHVANVIRRLKRICNYYGSNPVFICTSATIENPLELATALTEEDITLVHRNGAPSGEKNFIFYNPPIVHKALNVRRSATLEVRKLASQLLKEKIQTIVFARSRVRVEILLTYLKELVKNQLGSKSIRAYRGGYLPKERREIEKGLRDGSIYGVVSTNALELGVDIGQLQACIMTGYPGTVASAWQQAGRAGRRQGKALVIYVAENNPLDQYIVQHPNYFFNKNPEKALINPNNLVILVDHIKCAAYELPFQKGDQFGNFEVEEILEYLTEERILHENSGKWYWMSDSFPAHNISLRSASQENVVIIDQTNSPNHRVIGEMDRFSAMTLLHDEAIYLHQGTQFQVEYLDWEEKKAFVREVNVDYFTDANLAVQLKVLEIDKKSDNEWVEKGFGDVTIQAMATIFKKIKFETHENIGSGPIHLPEEELHTNAAWISLLEEFGEKEEMEQGLMGAAHALSHIIPLFVMCDRNDIVVTPQVKASHNEKPTLFFYDRYPGGIGLSEKVYENIEEIISETKQMISSCPCNSGCPTCIGMDTENERAKKKTLELLDLVC